MKVSVLFVCALLIVTAAAAEEFPKPYSAPCTERENVFAFTAKPKTKLVAKDKYEITFAVKGNCDVTVGLIDGKGTVVRHLASGVLGCVVQQGRNCLVLVSAALQSQSGHRE